jgi:UDP-N-acetylmuramoylalanine--D-glutamate ligase
MLKTELDGKGRGRAYVGGNIGYPLLPKMSEMSENDFAVVELSSFQLQTMRRSPRRALITNVSPNHLDWHTGMDEYIAAKRNICSHEGIELLVVNADNDVTRKIGEEVAVATTYFSSKKSKYSDIVPQNKQNCRAIYEDAGYIYVDDGNDRRAILRVSDILIPGRHNVENYMAAIALTDGLVSSETVRAVATTFKGVEHRLELVRELDGVRYYNSSIDSSPTRTQAAISALTQPPIIICGGYDKEIPFDTLAKTLCTKVKAVVLTGATADKIMAEIERCDEYSADTINIKMIPDFKDAVLAARDLAEKGDIVLLSPACASFDAFKNFEERGNYFKDIINGL